MMSLATSEEGETDLSKATFAIMVGGLGVLASPVILTGLLADKLELNKAADIDLCVATSPIGILLAPITVPLSIAVFAKELRNNSHGDLSPVSEDEL